MSAVMELVEPTETRTQPTEVIASLTDITKRYSNGVLALDGLSLELRRGEIVALLGPNGAGKSTAVKLMLGLSTPTAGTVRIFGADPRAAAARVRTGAMLQIGTAPLMLRVREHITMFRGYYPNPMPYAEIVRAAGLEGIEDRMFGQLSGGQRQRMLFALSLAGNPDLIFLDEPTVGLDIEARRGLWTQIRALAAQGKTVLLTTHYLEEADALAHRIIVVNKGRVICQGTPAEVKSMGNTGSVNPTSSAIRTIRCMTTLAVETLRALPGVVSAQTTSAAATIVTSRPEAALREMLALDTTLHSLEVTPPALEDAFLALTSNHS
ncbi:MAG: ABC transporter ATP-binding protein [Acidobacteriaceae bacterium]